MSRRCLYCGMELPEGSRGWFCKSSGHHILYKRQLLNALANGTITDAQIAHLNQFNWMPAQANVTTNELPFGVVEAITEESPATDESEANEEIISVGKFGVELECVVPSMNGNEQIVSEVNSIGYHMNDTGYTHVRTSYWKSLYDASVRAFDPTYTNKEYVSPPLVGEDGIKEMKAVCEVIKKAGGQTNYTTGTHVHLDASDLTPQDIAKIIYFYGRFEGQFDSLFPESRHLSKNRFCKSVKRFVKYCKRSGFEYFDSVFKLERVMNTRYVKVNVYSYLKHGTIEFRQHDGVLDGEALEMWIRLITRVVKYVKDGGDVVNVRGKIFKILGCTKKETQYWESVREAQRAA